MKKENVKINSTHPRDLLSGICRGCYETTDPRQRPSGERFKEKSPDKGTSGAPQRCGFTLIELLVVVLIIGILAAVAVPKYQFAVDKSRATQLLIQGRAILEAQNQHYIATGKWTSDLDVLDIELPKDWSCSAGSGCRASLSSCNVVFEINSYFNVGKYALWCASKTARGKKVCEVWGTYHHKTNETNYYVIHKAF